MKKFLNNNQNNNSLFSQRSLKESNPIVDTIAENKSNKNRNSNVMSLGSQSNIQMEESFQINSPSRFKQEPHNLQIQGTVNIQSQIYNINTSNEDSDSELEMIEVNNTETFNKIVQKDYYSKIQKNRNENEIINQDNNKIQVNNKQQNVSFNTENKPGMNVQIHDSYMSIKSQELLQSPTTEMNSQLFSTPDVSQKSPLNIKKLNKYKNLIKINSINEETELMTSQDNTIFANNQSSDQQKSKCASVVYPENNNITVNSGTGIFTPKYIERQQKKLKSNVQGDGHNKQALLKFIAVLVHTIQFKNKIKYFSQESSKIRNLSKTQLRIIGDNCYTTSIQDQIQESIKFSYFYQLLEKIPLILPNKIWKLWIDLLVNSFIIYRMFVVTIKLVFFFDDIYGCLDMIDKRIIILINILYFVDVILNLNTGFYRKGIIITDKKQIFMHYFKGDLLKSTLAQIPQLIQYFIDQNSSYEIVLIQYLLESLIFLQYYCVSNVWNRVERILTENERIASFFPLVRLVAKIILVAHFVGLLWIFCASMEMYALGEKSTWIAVLELQDTENENHKQQFWVTIYINAFYWAVSTMVTILLYIPETNIELVFSIFAIFICGGIFGYALNIIGNILDDISKKEIQFKNERQMVNRFLKRNEINVNLKDKIQLYIDYIQSEEKNKNAQEESQVLNRLSKQLQIEIKQNIFSKIIKQFDIIYKNFSEYTINQCMLHIDELIVGPDAIIFEQGDTINKDLYLLQRGEVQIKQTLLNELSNENDKDVIFKNYQQNQIIGIQEFFTGQQRSLECKSLTSATLYKINRQKFIDIINQQQNDYEIFVMIKDNIMQNEFESDDTYYQNKQDFQCQLCNSLSHREIQCNTIEYRPNFQEINKKQIGLQYRLQFYRDRLKYNIWENLQIVQQHKIDIFEAKNEISEQAKKYQEFYEIQNIQKTNIQDDNQMYSDQIESDSLQDSSEYDSEDDSDSQEINNNIKFSKNENRQKQFSEYSEQSSQIPQNEKFVQFQPRFSKKLQQGLHLNLNMPVVEENRTPKQSKKNQVKKQMNMSKFSIKSPAKNIQEIQQKGNSQTPTNKNRNYSLQNQQNFMNQSQNVINKFQPRNFKKSSMDKSRPSNKIFQYNNNDKFRASILQNKKTFFCIEELQNDYLQKKQIQKKQSILSQNTNQSKFPQLSQALQNNKLLHPLDKSNQDCTTKSQTSQYNHSEINKNQNQVQNQNKRNSILNVQFFEKIMSSNVIKDDNILEQKREWDVINFDKAKEFSIYYKHNNYTTILKHYKIIERVLQRHKRKKLNSKLKTNIKKSQKNNRSIFSFKVENSQFILNK